MRAPWGELPRCLDLPGSEAETWSLEVGHCFSSVVSTFLLEDGMAWVQLTLGLAPVTDEVQLVTSRAQSRILRGLPGVTALTPRSGELTTTAAPGHTGPRRHNVGRPRWKISSSSGRRKGQRILSLMATKPNTRRR